jgi:glycerol uptake facilitator-like aquaporin
MIAKYDENGADQLIPNAAMIAGTLYVMLNTAGKISGAALNPAVGLCQQIF